MKITTWHLLFCSVVNKEKNDGLISEAKDAIKRLSVKVVTISIWANS